MCGQLPSVVKVRLKSPQSCKPPAATVPFVVVQQAGCVCVLVCVAAPEQEGLSHQSRVCLQLLQHCVSRCSLWPRLLLKSCDYNTTGNNMTSTRTTSRRGSFHTTSSITVLFTTKRRGTLHNRHSEMWCQLPRKSVM